MLNRLIGNKAAIPMIDEMILANSVIVKRIKQWNLPTKQILQYKFELKIFFRSDLKLKVAKLKKLY